MDGVMIAFLPTTDDWCNIDLPHMTLVYSGKVEDHSRNDFIELAKDAAAVSNMTREFTTSVMKVGPMGQNEEQVAALIFRRTPELDALRKFVEKWNKSEYKEFVPHCTIGKYPIDTTNLPKYVRFNRVLLAWGDERMVFSLRP